MSDISNIIRVFHLFLHCSVTHCDIVSSQHKTVFIRDRNLQKKDELGFAVQQCTRSAFVVKEHVVSQNQ